jgi:transcriptional regulator with XRE-family HTH domain
MYEERSPARPWFDLVMEQIAIKGWSVTELARRSGVGRPTIYRWRDGTETPQARPVGLVADALGIPRPQAVRLAGIITDAEVADRSPPTLLDGAVGSEDAELVRKALRQVYPGQAEEILAGIEEKLKRRRAAGR